MLMILKFINNKTYKLYCGICIQHLKSVAIAFQALKTNI